MLIDSSAWIEFFRPKGAPAVQERVASELRLLRARWTEPVQFELLVGCRSPRQADLVVDALALCHRDALQTADWTQAATFNRNLTEQGLRLPAMDLLIAAVALRNDRTLVTCDSDFEVLRDRTAPALRVERIG